MRLSIFTPTHSSKYLPNLASSLVGQEFDEWVVLVNGSLSISTVTKLLDPFLPKLLPASVSIIALEGKHPIGKLKQTAALNCTGDILMEVDHDDELLPTACSKVKRAFALHPKVGFVSSDCAHFIEEVTGTYRSPPRYREDYGWSYYTVDTPKGRLDVPSTPLVCPTSVSRIWFAPDHVRAWRAHEYRAMGGHNPDLWILDDQELMMRTYLATPMHQIREPLYLYRRHEEQTFSQKETNRKIQRQTMELYHEWIERLQLHWAKKNGLACIDLGCGPDGPREGYKGWDKDAPYDIPISQAPYTLVDLNYPWPTGNGSVGVFLANDIFEHLPDKLHTMRELYRCLAHGGMVFSQTPSTEGTGAFSDPTHVSYWNEQSFLYLTDAKKAKWIGTPVRFQELYRQTSAANELGERWVWWHGLALKDGPRPPGGINV